jgi:hypothetical protein
VSTQVQWTDEHDLKDRLTEDVTAHPPCIILDFDETLWLRNSTEEFLAHVRPRIVAALILQILGLIKPWMLLSRQHPERYRDWIRIGVLLAATPWSWFTWRKYAIGAGLRHANASLLHIVTAVRPRRVVVATYGFAFIVKPLLASIDTRLDLVAASSLFHGTRLRRIGKGEAIRRVIGSTLLSQSVAITDSAIDRDLCDSCKYSYYVRWKDAVYEQARLTPMIPLVYTVKVKRPRENYLLNGILGYDYVVLWLAFALLSPTLLATSIAIGCYLLAFFAVYEIGYHDNDRVGLVKEARPVVSPEYALYGHHFRAAWAWAFGIGFAALGAAVQTYVEPSSVTRIGQLDGLALLVWRWSMTLLLLCVTRLTFMWFNALSPKMRMIPMLVLQLERTLGYALMMAIDRIGTVLCISHAIGRWIPYVIYRYGGERRDFPAHIATLIVFLACLPVVLVSDRLPASSALTFEFYVITTYLALRALKNLLSGKRTRAPALSN